ncbi:PP2C family protein-serine/threonine phosphatase [Natronospira bacteriovora]|uniref:Protein phosphatase 2C domain-containing protein n=1 Tax=Natronospira bacteriovora TaxID=3069753 RepID=A0ABU0W839_9GAMM|nr:protein phosphatase 2C domain-containing protein [Natronospira sp. AB-CW4]MDQ2070194.1 protein phosphatase 2C domain-containing protein [Natronospira sp. AB-CW4]
MEIETADVSRTGHRQSNQDRLVLMVGDEAVMLGVADGMGGHADGALAAETAVLSWTASFKSSGKLVRAPVKFLENAMHRAHRKVAELAEGTTIDKAPRTTGVLALISSGNVRWIHAGDSRAYLIRDGQIRRRSRDHSVVDELLTRGQIDDQEALAHPMRHLVDSCLGGPEGEPALRLRRRLTLRPGDVVLLCSDGFWGALDMDSAASRLGAAADLDACLEALAEEAERNAAPESDNITAVAMRWQG